MTQRKVSNRFHDDGVYVVEWYAHDMICVYVHTSVHVGRTGRGACVRASNLGARTTVRNEEGGLMWCVVVGGSLFRWFIVGMVFFGSV